MVHLITSLVIGWATIYIIIGTINVIIDSNEIAKEKRKTKQKRKPNHEEYFYE